MEHCLAYWISHCCLTHIVTPISLIVDSGLTQLHILWLRALYSGAFRAPGNFALVGVFFIIFFRSASCSPPAMYVSV